MYCKSDLEILSTTDDNYLNGKYLTVRQIIAICYLSKENNKWKDDDGVGQATWL